MAYFLRNSLYMQFVFLGRAEENGFDTILGERGERGRRGRGRGQCTREHTHRGLT